MFRCAFIAADAYSVSAFETGYRNRDRRAAGRHSEPVVVVARAHSMAGQMKAGSKHEN
jgi:hypothetical protein